MELTETRTRRKPGPSSRRHPAARALGLALGGLLAVYLVGRGVAEFFIVHYSDPASYRVGVGVPERTVTSGRNPLRGGGPGSAHRLPDLLRDDRGRVLAGDYREKRGDRVRPLIPG